MLDDLISAIRYWILDGHTPIPAPDARTWGPWFATAERHVALTALTPEVTVSTVFLGRDPRGFWSGPPRLFETMVLGFPDAGGDVCARYETWEQAERGHQTACAAVERLLRGTDQEPPGSAPAPCWTRGPGQALDPRPAQA